MSNTYTFTPKQKLYFERHQMAFNSAIQNGIQMICTDNDMEGQWQIRPDGKGLERVDRQAQAMSPEAPETAVEDSTSQTVNGSVTH